VTLPTPRYAVTVRTSADTWYFPYVFTGLSDLAHEGVITLAVRPDLVHYEPGMYATRIDVRDFARGCVRRVLFDLKDSASGLLPRYLSDHDVVFKRTFVPEVIADAIPTEHRAKVLPMGPIFPTRSRHEHGLPAFEAARLFHVLRRLTLPEMVRPRRVLGRLKSESVVPSLEQRRLPFIDELEHPPTTAEPFVLFQTRLFDPDPHGVLPEVMASKHEVNAQRVALVRQLRRELGPRFLGGVPDTPYARHYCPDAITPLPTERSAFLRLVRQTRVAVYTKGLVDSVAFKFGEFFAASRCIIAERPRAVLAHPPVDGVDLVYFDQLDECVARCVELSDDADRAQALAGQARRYYEAWVRPRTAVLEMLERATS
jgi:hypothetical protein